MGNILEEDDLNITILLVELLVALGQDDFNLIKHELKILFDSLTALDLIPFESFQIHNMLLVEINELFFGDLVANFVNLVGVKLEHGQDFRQ